MNLLFVNNFEKKLQDKVVTAQVTIGEHKGTWVVIWNEEINQTTWYKGADWQEMMRTFRIKLEEKVSEGFAPVIETSLGI